MVNTISPSLYQTLDIVADSALDLSTPLRVQERVGTWRPDLSLSMKIPVFETIVLSQSLKHKEVQRATVGVVGVILSVLGVIKISKYFNKRQSNVRKLAALTLIQANLNPFSEASALKDYAQATLFKQKAVLEKKKIRAECYLSGYLLLVAAAVTLVGSMFFLSLPVFLAAIPLAIAGTVILITKSCMEKKELAEESLIMDQIYQDGLKLKRELNSTRASIASLIPPQPDIENLSDKVTPY